MGVLLGILDNLYNRYVGLTTINTTPDIAVMIANDYNCYRDICEEESGFYDIEEIKKLNEYLIKRGFGEMDDDDFLIFNPRYSIDPNPWDMPPDALAFE